MKSMLKLSTSMAALSLTLLLAQPSQAAGLQIEGHDFAETVSIANRNAKLNGVGIRAVLWLKGYVAGLYVERPSRDAHVLLQAAGAKRLSLIMLREAETEVFVKAVRGGIEKNLTPEQIAALAPRLERFDTTIRGIGKVKEGDVVDLDYVPEKGLVLSYNGAVRGNAVEGKDFYEAILGIFIGDNPVDKSLKQGLLGLKKPPRKVTVEAAQ